MKLLKKLKWSERLVAFILAAAFLGTAAGPVFSEAEAEKGLCEHVAMRCLADAIASGFLSLGASLVPQIAFCVVGYSFCERYVEPLLYQR
jgi:hypothetical protein